MNLIRVARFHNNVSFICFSRDPLWSLMRKRAQDDASAEPLLSSFMFSRVLSHGAFEESLAFVLATRLESDTLGATFLTVTFLKAMRVNPCIVHAARCDAYANVERDPACESHLYCVLFSTGYQALQSYRIAHHLWMSGSR